MAYTSPIGEAIVARLRKLDIAAQAVKLRVDAAMIDFTVVAQLVASDNNALRRFIYHNNVWFTDGPTGDDGLAVIGSVDWPAEAVTFTDGTTGDNGLVIFLPIHAADEVVTFTEDAYDQAFSIHDDEYVAFVDYSVQFILDFLRAEQVIYSDISIAWEGEFLAPEAVTIIESFVMAGGNSIALAEAVNISEVLLGANSFVFGDSVTLFEFWDTGLAFPLITEAVTWTDKLVVSQVAATDARPGAFIPGSALLGSPT